MELTLYILLTIVGILFSLNKNASKNNGIFFVAWIVLYFILSLVVRIEFDEDIKIYASSMSYTSLSIYYIREPVFWLGQRYLFEYINNSYIVFVVYDVVAGIVLFKAFSNLKVPRYAYFGILIFFPFILGMQNIYRQWLASIIFLYSFSLVWKEDFSLKPYATFLLSCLTHNVAAIFFPLLLIKNKNPILKFFWLPSFIISFAGVYLGAEEKSSADTGDNLSMAYLLLLLTLFFLTIALDKGKILQKRIFEYKLIFSLFILALMATINLSSAGSERVSMFCLIIVYPVLAILFDERFKQKEPIRMAYISLGFIPMFIFSVSIFII